MARGDSPSPAQSAPAIPGADQPGPEIVVRVDRRRGLVSIVLLTVMALALLFAARSCETLLGLANPFHTRTTDRSQPVLLESIKDLSRYQAATANMQVIVDVEKDAKFIPSAIYGQRTLFVAAGTVDAYVDFAGLGSKGLTVSGDRRSVEVTVPRPGLEKPNLDHDRSYVVSQKMGVIDRVQAFLGNDPNRVQELNKVAEKKIADAATQSELPKRAEQNTRIMLTGLLKSLGFTTVTVEFAGP
jgi:hypothetical protein